jgi:hypothetical protein
LKLGTFDECTDMHMATKVVHIRLNIRTLGAVKTISLSMNDSNGGNFCRVLMDSPVVVPILGLGGEVNGTQITANGGGLAGDNVSMEKMCCRSCLLGHVRQL